MVYFIRPWIYDNNKIHLMRVNTYTFVKDGEVVTLYPMKQEPRPGVPKESLQVRHVYGGYSSSRSNSFTTRGMMQSLWASTTRTMAHMWNTKKSRILFLVLSM